jgi:hypothetical protein
MSASSATTIRSRFESASTGSARLRLVRRVPADSPRLPFALLVIGLVAAGLVGLLIVNTSMQSGAFEVGRLQQQNQLLSEQQGDLQRQVQQLSSPVAVTNRAAALGMVADPNPGFLRLSDSKVLGSPQPAGPDPTATKPAAKKPVTPAKPAVKKPAVTKKPATTGAAR